MYSTRETLWNTIQHEHKVFSISLHNLPADNHRYMDWVKVHREFHYRIIYGHIQIRTTRSFYRNSTTENLLPEIVRPTPASKVLYGEKQVVGRVQMLNDNVEIMIQYIDLRYGK